MAPIHKPVLLVLFLLCQTKAFTTFFRAPTAPNSENIPSHEKSGGLETNLTKEPLANNPSQANGQGDEKPKLSTENIPKPNAIVPQQEVERSKLSKDDIQKSQQLENELNPKDSRTNVNVDLKNDKLEVEKKSIGVEKVQENGKNSQNESSKLNRGISRNMTDGMEKGNEKKGDDRDGKKKEIIENVKGEENVNDKQKVGEIIAEEKKLKQEISYLKKRSRSSLEKMPSGEIEILDKELDDYIKVLHTEMEKRNKKRKTEKEEAQIKEIQGEIKQAKVLDEKLEQIEEIKEEKEKTNNGEGTMNQNQPLENEGHQQQQHYVADYFWPHHPIYDYFEQKQPMIGYSPSSYQNQEPMKIQSFHSHEPFKFYASSNGQQGKNSLNKHKNRPKMEKKSLELNQKPTNNVAILSSAPTAVSESAAKNLPQMDSNMSDPDHAKRVLDWERVWKWAETNNQVNKAKRKEETNNNIEANNSKQLQNGGVIDGDKNKPNQKGTPAGEFVEGMAKEKSSATDNKKSPKTWEPTKVETLKPVSKPEETLKPKSGDEKSNSKNNATNNAATTLAKESQSKGNDGKMKEATKQNEKEGKNVESKKGDDSDNKAKNKENLAGGKEKNNENSASGKRMTNEVSASASGKEKNKENSADAKGKNVTDSEKIETAKQPNKKQKVEGEAPKTAPAAKKGDEQQQGVRPKKKGGKGNSQNTTIQNNINSSSSSNSSEEDPKAKNGKCETTKVKNEGETTNKKKRKRGEGFGYDQSESDESEEAKAKKAKVGNGQATATGVYIG